VSDGVRDRPLDRVDATDRLWRQLSRFPARSTRLSGPAVTPRRL